MTKVSIFAIIATLLEDKQSVDLKIQKVGDELVLLVDPKINGKTAAFTMSGTPEEMDEHFITELQKPIEKIKAFVSTADKAEVADDETEEKDKKPAKKGKPEKPAPAKGKKSPAKKGKDTETSEEESEEEEESETEEEEEKTPEPPPIDHKKLYGEFIERAKAAFGIKKYMLAGALYEKALEHKPEDQAATEGARQCKLWVSNLTEMGLLKETEEEVQNELQGN